MKSKNTYSIPLKNGKKPHWSPTHFGRFFHSLDFGCPEGTEIFAAQGGVVVYVKDDSNEGGTLEKKYWDSGNRIVIKHENGEYTAYEHLRFEGSEVSVNQSVVKGDLIGYSGNTGFSSGPHLHFEVFINPTEDESEGKTVKVQFEAN